MGTKQSKPQPTIQTSNNTSFEHPRFKNAKIASQGSVKMIQVHYPLADESEYQKWVKELPSKQTKQNELYLMPLKHKFTNQGFCGSGGLVKIWYQMYPFCLSRELKERQIYENYFDQQQMWYLLLCLIEAGHHYHKKGLKVGDIRPENILINEDGHIKVPTHKTWPEEQSNYHKTFYNSQQTYLAPQQLKDIQFGKSQPSCNIIIAESFSIGMTCLDAGTLSNSKTLCNTKNKLNYEGVHAKLLQLRNAGYSQILIMTIEGLCQLDPQKRSTCSQIYQWLEPYSQNIKNLECFEARDFPNKIQQHRIHNYDQRGQQMYCSRRTRVYRTSNSPQTNNYLHQNQYQGVTVLPNAYENWMYSSQNSHKTTDTYTSVDKNTYYNYEPQNGNPHIFISPTESQYQNYDQYCPRMEKTMKQVDEQLAKSRKMFP